MAHPNEDLVRRGFTAFGTGDIATLGELFADNIVWHVGGRSPITGDYKGKEQVFGFLPSSPNGLGGPSALTSTTCWRTTSMWSRWSRRPGNVKGRR